MAHMFFKLLTLKTQLENIWKIFPEGCDYWNALKYLKCSTLEYWKSEQILCRELNPSTAGYTCNKVLTAKLL